MKKLIVLTLVFVLLSVTFVPAMAKGGGTNGKQLYAIAGYIRGINEEDQTITVEVLVGNRIGDNYLEQEVVIEVVKGTRLLLSGGTPITFSYFKIDQSVSSNGILADTDNDGELNWTADRITVGALLLDF